MALEIVRRLPIIGNDIYQVGQVVDIVSQPCTPVPKILVYAFFANIPTLVWSLVKPTPEDYLTERLGRRHKRRRKNRFTMADFDVGPPPGKRGMAWVEFASIKFIERVGWYLLVADATTDFALNWTSMAYRYSGCQDPTSGYASGELVGNHDWFSTGAPNRIATTTQSFQGGYFANPGNVRKNTAGARMASHSLSIGVHPSNPKGVVSQVYLQSVTDFTTRTYQSEGFAPNPDGSRPWAGNYRGYDVLEPAATYSTHVVATEGWMRVTAHRLTVSGFEEGLESDP